MRNDLTHTTVISKYEDLVRYLGDPSFEVTACIPINEDMFYINWKGNQNNLKPSQSTNIFIAAYTTALARIHLYSYLSKLGERALYCDTDSVIYKHTPNKWLPDHGNYLGEMMDELCKYGAGSYIDTFACGGPKNYAFRIRVNGAHG